MQPFVYNAHAARVVFGAGALSKLAEEIERLGAKKALVLCTPEQADAGLRVAALRVLACADDPGRLRERRETNNCAVAPACCAHGPNSRQPQSPLAGFPHARRTAMSRSTAFSVLAVPGLIVALAVTAHAAPDPLQPAPPPKA